jgi:hypothetical protein
VRRVELLSFFKILVEELTLLLEVIVENFLELLIPALEPIIPDPLILTQNPIGPLLPLLNLTEHLIPFGFELVSHLLDASLPLLGFELALVEGFGLVCVRIEEPSRTDCRRSLRSGARGSSSVCSSSEGVYKVL